MNYFSAIFTDIMRIFLGTNSIRFIEYNDFFYVDSHFKDEWYNFVVPKLSDPKKLNISLIDQIIHKSKSEGKKLSFYVNEKLKDNYLPFVKKYGGEKLGSDSYLVKEIGKQTNPNLPTDYYLSNEYSLNEVIKVLESCHPGWPGESYYCRLYEKYKEEGQEDRKFETIVTKHKQEIIGAGSVIVDTSLGLAYLHNAGVVKDHRRRGLHTALVDERCNFGVNHGVNKFISIAEEATGSYKGLIKNGFQLKDKFYLFKID
ncbi:GNAT family N-acetyltransferase [Candidatus Nomurabacteria bacterium]|uniref:GNAT family N-acetyltransferase n=1 Tax=candidate division WWE3 bacterium TaxID=2053526 RepID=A0A955E079_UNCKA|nr:GNAT family N-acetyltransferase [candidate division WWE3 bacterium]MCB9823400.1 GNAT family N-acetyltransferase [Candidatus Nomurabacteria bacterium]MCB9827682.1 GNAT family N-acetyltransferase [Candidatus Nomurabacteria bacterium]